MQGVILVHTAASRIVLQNPTQTVIVYDVAMGRTHQMTCHDILYLLLQMI